MPTYSVRVLGMVMPPIAPQDHTFTVVADNYGEAVVAVGTYLELELVTYRSFGGSQNLGR